MKAWANRIARRKMLRNKLTFVGLVCVTIVEILCVPSLNKAENGRGRLPRTCIYPHVLVWIELLCNVSEGHRKERRLRSEVIRCLASSKGGLELASFFYVR